MTCPDCGWEELVEKIEAMDDSGNAKLLEVALKAVSSLEPMLKVEETDDGWEAQVIFDV